MQRRLYHERSAKAFALQLTTARQQRMECEGFSRSREREGVSCTMERDGFSRAIRMHTTLPRRFYADPDFYRAELERFYVNRWICAGRADQIPNAGDYFTRALGDDSVIVTRDGSGEV